MILKWAHFEVKSEGGQYQGFAGPVAVYLASEADARIAELEAGNKILRDELAKDEAVMESDQARIAELEKALRSVRTELENNAGLRNEYQEWSDTFAIIDTALMDRS